MTWTSSEGNEIPLIRLEDAHLQNIERMLRGDGARPPSYEVAGGYDEIIRQHGMILREMARRGLPPLPWIRDQPMQPKPYRVTWVDVDPRLVRYMRIIAARRNVDQHTVVDESMVDYIAAHKDEIPDILEEDLHIGAKDKPDTTM